MDNNDDLDVDDITENLNKKKKIKSGRKGKTGEASVVKALNSRFSDIIEKNPSGGGFSRSIGSGNRFGQQVNLSKNAIEIFSGDLTTPPNFKFVVECKTGYNDIDLYNCIHGSCRELDEFLYQVSNDAARTNKIPLLVWKKDRKGHIAFMPLEQLTYLPKDNLAYKGWSGVSLDWLLTFSDEFFFE